MGLIDSIKRRLPIIGGPRPTPTREARPAWTPPPAPEEAPEPASPRGDTPVQDFITQTIKANPVVLFMKGNPAAPQCGFSANAAGILSSYGKPFSTVNVLSDPDIREGVKELTGWPTIPQVFIGGEFVGGADILKELHGSGELKSQIEAAHSKS